jgi:molecular chaperone HscB
MQFFEVFGIAAQFRLNTKELDTQYRALQAQNHPDKFSGASDAARRSAEQRSALINDGYATLKDPVRRAAYLIEHTCGADPFAQTNTKMPAAFLIAQMSLRDDLAEYRAANAADALETMREQVEAEAAESERALATLLDDARDMDAATVETRKLRFQQKLLSEIDDALAVMV